MKVHPVNDYVVVKVIKKPNRTVAGIYVTEDSESAQLNMCIAIVIAKGLGRMLDGGVRNPIDCQVGDYVEFAGGAPAFPYKSTELVEIDKSFEDCWVINFGHIHSIIVLGKDERFRTDAEDAAKAKKEYDDAARDAVPRVIEPGRPQVIGAQ